MGVNIFIYAQGRGSRWGMGTHGELPSEYKQLIPISNKSLIERTIEQCSGHDIWLFGRYDVFGHLSRANNDKYDTRVGELKEPTGSIIDGLCTTHMFWMGPEDAIILLGDVVFENSVIETILNYSSGQITFFGRMLDNKITGKQAREIFGLYIPEGKKDEFFGFLVRAVNFYGVYRSYKKLWDLWTLMLNSSVESWIFRNFDMSYTDDIDSPEDWYSYGNKLISLALEDDKHRVLAQEV